MGLPQFMVVRSGKYLCYAKRNGSTKGSSSTSSSLAFSHQPKRPNLDAVAAVSHERPNSAAAAVATEGFDSVKERIATSEKTPLEFHLLKFEVEEAKNVPGFVHIRTCYNNKYFVRESEKSKRVVAEAHEPEEDQTKWCCTLFKPIFLGEVGEEEEEECVYGSNKHGIGMAPQKIKLMHVAMGEEYYVSAESMELVKKEEAMAMGEKTSTLTVSDVTPSVALPMYVTFKCHDGSKYLGSPDWYGLHFVFSNMADQGVAMENLHAGRGPVNVGILCGNLQTKGGQWIQNQGMYVNLTQTLLGYLYTPVKVNGYVALFDPYYKKFLARDTTNDGCLTALTPNITDEAQFQVGEPVLSRTILKINYDLDNARVYGTTDVTKITDSRSNYTDHQDTGSLSREFAMSRTMKWSQSVTVGMGMSMKMTVGIPELGFGEEISINYSISETCTWGEEETKSEKLTHVYNFDVPPKTKQTKSVVASRSSCDVPFTCEVEDLLVDGTIHKYTIPDCWFTGANDYDATEKTVEEPLHPAA